MRHVCTNGWYARLAIVEKYALHHQRLCYRMNVSGFATAFLSGHAAAEYKHTHAYTYISDPVLS